MLEEVFEPIEGLQGVLRQVVVREFEACRVLPLPLRAPAKYRKSALYLLFVALVGLAVLHPCSPLVGVAYASDESDTIYDSLTSAESVQENDLMIKLWLAHAWFTSSDPTQKLIPLVWTEINPSIVGLLPEVMNLTAYDLTAFDRPDYTGAENYQYWYSVMNLLSFNTMNRLYYLPVMNQGIISPTARWSSSDPDGRERFAAWYEYFAGSTQGSDGVLENPVTLYPVFGYCWKESGSNVNAEPVSGAFENSAKVDAANAQMSMHALSHGMVLYNFYKGSYNNNVFYSETLFVASAGLMSYTVEQASGTAVLPGIGNYQGSRLTITSTDVIWYAKYNNQSSPIRNPFYWQNTTLVNSGSNTYTVELLNTGTSSRPSVNYLVGAYASYVSNRVDVPNPPYVETNPEPDVDGGDTNINIDWPDTDIDFDPHAVINVGGTTWNTDTSTDANLQPVIDAINNMNNNLGRLSDKFTNYYSDAINGIYDVQDSVDKWGEEIDNDIENMSKGLKSALGQYYRGLNSSLGNISENIQSYAKWIDTDIRTVIRWLRSIYYKIGGGTSSKPDISTDDNDFFDWWAEVIRKILESILGSTEIGAGLTNLGNLLSQLNSKFPFSIPWDVAAILALFAEDPVTPQVDLWLPSLGNDGVLVAQGTQVHVDLSILDDVAAVLRTVVRVGFAMNLLYWTRETLEGLSDWFKLG